MARKGVIHPKRRSRGRQSGSFISFRADADRFKLAFAAFAQVDLGLKRYDAAGFSVLLFAEEPLEISSVESQLTRLTVEPRCTTSVKSREERLVAKFRKFDARMTRDDVVWLTTSTSSLALLFNPPGHLSHPSVMHHAMSNLIALGWHDTLCHLVPRIERILKSNLPPSDEPLPPKVRRFLDHVRSNTLKHR